MVDRMRLRQSLGWLSPRRWRWERFLRTLPLDPDALPRPVEPLAGRDVILCGCPRTGTTLLTAALFQPPRCVSVMEPWDGMRLPPADLFRSLRTELDGGSLRRGRLDLGALRDEGAVRWCPEGRDEEPVEVDGSTVLAVKWPNYWRFLDLLPTTRFIVTLRHPAEVISSFARAGGRVGLGLQYPTRFNRELNRELRAATRDPALRRVLLFDHVHRRLLPHLERPEVLVVRYERWFQDPEALLAEIGAFLDCDLSAPLVRVRAPASDGRLDDRDRALLAAHCTTAEALGYEL